MKARVLKPYYDREGRTDREPGDMFEATQSRLDEINGAGFGELVEVIAEKPVRHDEERTVAPRGNGKRK